MPNVLPPVNVRERRLVLGVAQGSNACLYPQASFAQPPSPQGKGRAEAESVAEGKASRGSQATKYGVRELARGKVLLNLRLRPFHRVRFDISLPMPWF